MSGSRKNVIDIARAWIGKNEYDGSHKEVIDIYNANRPRGAYKMRYTDHWCATFVSAVAIKSGITDILPVQVSCEQMIKAFKKIGSWMENDAYKPKAGDIIFYDWQDTGVGDNRGWSDHVGIVEKVTGNTMTIIEGNMSNKVGRRNIKVDSRYIRGYGLPKYIGRVSNEKQLHMASKSLDIKVGDVVSFVGNKHYTNSYKGARGYKCISGKAKVTYINLAGAHPYHLEHIGEKSTVFGWVDKEDIIK